MRNATLAILVLVALIAAPVLAQHGGHVVAMPDTLKWVEPATLPGARLAVVHGDPSKEGLFVYRLKMPARYKIPPHFHKASENVTVLAGTFSIGLGEKFDQGSGQELPVGGFVAIPPKHPHYAWAGGQETVVQVHGVGPTDLTFVNPADDPRKKN
jgi:quercetin dioxygenase-like cupin family protein